MRQNSAVIVPLVVTALLLAAAPSVRATASPANLAKDKLVAWCIVPFDAKQRGPEARAKMLKSLGITRSAYDWRKQHVDQFEDEILAYKKHGIEFFAFWGQHDKAFALFEKHGIKPQIWQMLRSPKADTQAARIEAAAKAVEPLAARTKKMGCKLALYNHGGWGGEPANLVAVCKRLHAMGYPHVGIVYNWHHGHGHIDDWAASLEMMKPYLHCLNLNGMNTGAKPKILALGKGEHDAAMLRTLVASGYDGPIGILDHLNHVDTEIALRANLDGLDALKQQLGGHTFSREPIDKASRPHWNAHINREREYDFYAKQAMLYGKMDAKDVPDILPVFPGIDGAKNGHWGNQNDQTTWKDNRVFEMKHGSMVSGVFRGGGKTIARAVIVELGDGFRAVFNQDTLRFEVAWRGKAVEWSNVRRGLIRGLKSSEKPIAITHADRAAKGSRFVGIHRSGERVVFAYESNGKTAYREAKVIDGKVVESLVDSPKPGAARWPQRITTQGELGSGNPYAIDTLTLPHDNPWKALVFVSGVDFLSATRIAICTMHGDVWLVDINDPAKLSTLTWKRFAAGLHQPLGLKVVDGVVHVMCRDQIVALHDRNGDDEADFYACASNAHATSKGGHDYITGLQRDDKGRWYFASGNQGVCRVSPDGKKLDVLATGFRNPNGLGVSPDGSVVLTSVQEGNWTPASAVCEIVEGGHFGAGGPRKGELGNVPPLVYLPRGTDNSSGGQTYIDSDRWGPVRGNWIHYSYGYATHFLLLREVINGRSQAAAVSLPGEFLSGAHRGRFSPHDGQLYVAAAQGWGSYGVDDGALQRVRYTGGHYPYPTKFETRDNGILLTFADPQSADIADTKRWFAQMWNYRYGPAYGSPEFSVRNPSIPGHDPLAIRGVHRLDDGRRVFIEIPQLQPTNQLHLHFAGSPRVEMFATLHNLGEPFTDFPGYQKIAKSTVAAQETVNADDPKVLMAACAACHHPTNKLIGPPLAEIRQRYKGNPDGIVKWAMDPQLRNPELPPMPSFKFLGEKKLKIIAKHILAE